MLLLKASSSSENSQELLPKIPGFVADLYLGDAKNQVNMLILEGFPREVGVEKTTILVGFVFGYGDVVMFLFWHGIILRFTLRYSSANSCFQSPTRPWFGEARLV